MSTGSCRPLSCSFGLRYALSGSGAAASSASSFKGWWGTRLSWPVRALSVRFWRRAQWSGGAPHSPSGAARLGTANFDRDRDIGKGGDGITRESREGRSIAQAAPAARRNSSQHGYGACWK